MPRLDLVRASGRAQRPLVLPSSSAEDPEFVAAAARALTVLQAFTPEAPELGNAEIAQRCGYPKSTVSRLTYTLAKLGFLRLEPQTQRYRLGPSVVGLARGFLGARGVREVAAPYMEALAMRFRAPVALTERDGLDMLYLAYARGNAPVIVAHAVGSRLPLTTSAAGRAWLAAAHPVEAAAVREQLAQQLGAGWDDAARRLDDAARDLQRLGFTRSYRELQAEVNSVAVPLRSPVDGSLAVFNLAAPAALVSTRRFDAELGPALQDMVAAVARELDAQGPTPPA
jgi:DNA-binding IclR family transcriptional regulator